MKLLEQLEDSIASISDKLPSLPEGFSQGIANWAWLLSAIAGAASILTAWNLWSIYAACTVGLCPSTLGVFPYLSIAAALICGVLYLVAIRPLKMLAKRGWDLIFIATLVNLGAAIIFILAGSGGSLISALVTVAIVWFILFEIRPKFQPTKES